LRTRMEEGGLGEARRWILWGIPFVFSVGSLLHFAYDWSGQSAWVGVFAPVNESVWEHLKMAFWPMLFWWALGCFILRKNALFSPVKWWTAGARALWVSPFSISALFYLYTGALGVESLLLLDILLFLASVAFGQLLALRAYTYAPAEFWRALVSAAAVALLAAAFVWCTFAPPRLPYFQDAVTGAYGIHAAP